MTLPASLDQITQAEAAAARGQWAEVRQQLPVLAAHLTQAEGMLPPAALGEAAPTAEVVRLQSARRRLRALAWQSAAFWWQPLHGAGLMLRRTRSEDADFYRHCFSNPDFARRYNRQVAWTGDIRKALDKAGLQSPVESGAVHWIIASSQGQALGMASLSSLNLTNARAEVSIGFPAAGSPLHGVMAMLLIYDFAFFKARLNKLTSYVYTANHEALHNSLRVGLRQEGELKDHFYLPPGEFVDVHVLGLTRAQLQADERLVQMARRRLGLRWVSQPGA